MGAMYICSDSVVAFTTLQNMTRECHNTSQSYAKVHAVEMFWIPGNQGINSNKKPNDHARMAARQTFMSPELAVGIF